MHHRIDRKGTIQPLVHPLTSGHASYRIAVRTARRRHERTGCRMGVIAWHDGKYVVMPWWDAATFEAEDLLVEYY